MPGQAGNAAVAGHRTTYGHPFYNLDSVKVGDPIVFTTLQGIFVYDTTKSFVVSPSDTAVVDAVLGNQLTLTTCNPRFSATTRLVVQATLAHSRLFVNSGLPAKYGQAASGSEEPETGRQLQRWAHRHTLLGIRHCSCRGGHLLRGLPLPTAALGHLRRRARSAPWCCSGSSSGPSVRCSPPASSRRVRRRPRPTTSGASPPHGAIDDVRSGVKQLMRPCHKRLQFAVVGRVARAPCEGSVRGSGLGHKARRNVSHVISMSSAPRIALLEHNHFSQTA